jgi:hypothetical protein
MKEDKVTDQAGRKIVTTYTLENNYRVKLSTYHYGSSKAIRSTLSECITGTSGMFTMETFMMFRDHNELVISEPVSRYSFKLLEDQHGRALEAAAAAISSLLAQGEAGARECQVDRVA